MKTLLTDGFKINRKNGKNKLKKVYKNKSNFCYMYLYHTPKQMSIINPDSEEI